jgi:hypothetical protein
VHFTYRHLEVSYRNSIVGTLCELLGPIIHGVELSNFVCVTDSFEQGFDIFTGPCFSEIMLLNAQLGVVRWEEKVNCFGLITIILKNV